MPDGKSSVIRNLAKAEARLAVPEDFYPDGWLERQSALDSGEAKPRDWERLAHVSETGAKDHGRRCRCWICDG